MTHSQQLLNPALQAQGDWSTSIRDWYEEQVDGMETHAYRLRAWEQFKSAKLPNTRDEDWKYTRLSALWKQKLTLSPHHPVLDISLLASFDWHALGTVLCFVDGRFSMQNSTPSADWETGLTIEPWVGLRLRALPEDKDVDALQTLARASLSSGVHIHVASNVQLSKPIIIQQIGSMPNGLNSVWNQFSLAVGASATFIEVSLGAREGVTLSQCSIDVAQNAQCTHLLWQDTHTTAHSFGWRDVTLARDARFMQRSLLVGGALSRQQLTVTLMGENAESDVATGVIAMSKQTLDVRTHTRHACMNARSKQLHRFAIGGQANGVFHGDIVVEKGADKTDANMATNNLLLSPTAQANSKPQLEIYADDVRCTHGVTSGNVDDAQIFYLRARGIPAEKAKLMISAAFAQSALDDVPVEAIRVAWQQAIANKLQQA
jgi:Fe-S cluster assembly protein SufD